jgi:hypothetical protein
MHLSGMASRVSQIDLNAGFRRLFQSRHGAPSANGTSHASAIENGIESNHPSHCASDIPSKRRLIRALGMILSTAEGASRCISA